MSSSSVSTKSVRNLEKPKPLRLNATRSVRPVSLSSPITEPNTHANRLSTGSSSVLELMSLLDKVATQLSNAQYDLNLTNNIDLLYSQMKLYGSQIESGYQTEVDNAFVPIRNGTVSEKLDEASRLKLLHLVELRSAGWKSLHTEYYSHTISKANETDLSSISTHSMDSLLTPITPPPNALPVLGPGELVKSSGKYPKPTKIPGKNYCKDEVVIRNADSGKVHPGARERNVQITGPNPDNIVHATHLIDETIRKNMSPVRELQLQDSILLDSNSSLNSSQSDDSGLKLLQTDDSPLDFANFRHTLSFGNNRHVMIVGNDYNLVNNVVVLVEQNKHLVGATSRSSLISAAGSQDEDYLSYPTQRPVSTFAPLSSPLGLSYLPPAQDLLPPFPPPPLQDILPPLDVYLESDKSKLSRSKSDVSMEPPTILPLSSLSSFAGGGGAGSTTSSTSLLTNKISRVYSRDFLIMCSKSPLSQKKPSELVYIELNYSELIKPVNINLHSFVTNLLDYVQTKPKNLFVL